MNDLPIELLRDSGTVGDRTSQLKIANAIESPLHWHTGLTEKNLITCTY